MCLACLPHVGTHVVLSTDVSFVPKLIYMSYLTHVSRHAVPHVVPHVPHMSRREQGNKHA
jgi:hypothetical protein